MQPAMTTAGAIIITDPTYYLWSLQWVGHLYAVEFVGGPLDGHKHVAMFPPEELAEIITLPINKNVIGMLHGRSRAAKQHATSAAVYQLRHTHGLWRYLYRGAASAKDSQLEAWVG